MVAGSEEQTLGDLLVHPFIVGSLKAEDERTMSMMALLHFLAVVAALTGGEVATIDVEKAQIVARMALPGEGVAVFAAPDGALLIPLAGSDATVLIPPLGTMETLSGRVFPLFHDEADRMVVVLEDGVAVLSYPERLELRRARIPLGAVWRAGLTRDGRILALLAGSPETELVVVDVLGGAIMGRVDVGAACRSLAVEPRGSWIAVGCHDGSVRLVRGGHASSIPLPAVGEVVALASSEDGRLLAAGVNSPGGAGWAVVLRIPERGDPRVVSSVELPGPLSAVAVAGDAVLAAAGDGVSVLTRRRLRVRGRIDLPGVRDFSVLPEVFHSLLPNWGVDQSSPDPLGMPR